MDNQLRFAYRTRSGQVEVRVSWDPSHLEYEMLDVEIELPEPGVPIPEIDDSFKARVRAEAFLQVLKAGSIPSQETT